MTDPQPTNAEQVARRLQTTRAAISAAEEHHRQTMRDVQSDGTPITAIAAAMGVANRRTIYAALDSEPVEPTVPAPTPVVYLRGAGNSADIWQAYTKAMHRRGWMTVRDRTQAWHLARGGVPVVLVDFSATLADHQVHIGRVTAKIVTTSSTRPVRTLLTPADRSAYAAANDDLWLDHPVQVKSDQQSLELLHTDKVTADPETAARVVAHHLS